MCFCALTISLIYSACATVNVATIKRTSDAFDKSRQTKGIICASFAISVSDDFLNFTDKMNIDLTLLQKESNQLVEISVADYQKASDSYKFHYLTLAPGTYKLVAIATSKSLGNTGFLQMGQLGDYDWNLGVVFNNQDFVKINAGDIIYIGSYRLRGRKESTKYYFTSLAIKDRFNSARSDLKSILGNDVSMQKKLGLIEDMGSLKYSFK